MNLKNTLEKIGLNPRESQIYMLLLESGPSSASGLAKKTNSPRSTVRSTLDKLCEKHLANKITEGSKQIYSCEKVENLKKLVQKKINSEKENLEELKKSLPLFKSLWGKSSYIPEVKFYQGIDGIIEAFNQSLYTGAKEVLSITSYRFFKNKRLEKNDDNFYIPTRVKKGIRIRVLTNHTAGAMKSKKTKKGKLREHRFLSGQFPISGNIHIHGEYVTFYSGHDKESSAVIIKSKIFSETLRTLFEVAWKNGKKG